MYFNSDGSYLDHMIRSYIDEDWYWYGTEDEDDFSDLPQSLADKLRNYFASGQVNLDSIPISIKREFRTHFITQDRPKVTSLARFRGTPIRPVCP